MKLNWISESTCILWMMHGVPAEAGPALLRPASNSMMETQHDTGPAGTPAIMPHSILLNNFLFLTILRLGWTRTDDTPCLPEPRTLRTLTASKGASRCIELTNACWNDRRHATALFTTLHNQKVTTHYWPQITFSFPLRAPSARHPGG